MINALHLLWIVPLSAALGFLLAALCAAAGRSSKPAWRPRCRTCRWCWDGIMAGLWCDHPDNRNPYGCNENDYCNCWAPRWTEEDT